CRHTAPARRPRYLYAGGRSAFQFGVLFSNQTTHLNKDSFARRSQWSEAPVPQGGALILASRASARAGHPRRGLARRRASWLVDRRELRASECARLGAVGVPRTPEPGEELAALRVVPVSERCTGHERMRGPRSAAQHLVLEPEEHLRVFNIGKRGE